MIEKLMVLFVSALDHRRIDPNHTPYLYSLTQRFPWTRMNNFPEVDLDPTLLTGLYPHEHGICQVRLKSNDVSHSKSSIDYLPDIAITTSQCFIHMLTGRYNLAAIPYWRRRRFEILKTRYDKKVLKNYLNLNGRDTLFKMISKSKCSYIYNWMLGELDQIKPEIFNKDLRFELIETHALDTISHWYINNKQKLRDSYNKIDSYIKFLHSECEKKGITLMFLTEHGMETVNKTFDIKQKIRELGIRDSEITYYIEASKTRFWFHSESAREKMVNYLSDHEDGNLLSWQDMEKYNIKFEDDSYGEYYFVLNPGTIFFPNDFYHPIANYYLGITNSQSRSRLFNPTHRGYHGYLPHNDSEKGTLVLLNDKYKPQGEKINTIDFVPTILNLLGYEQPESLKGRAAFHL